jgi:hypothetical protein
MSEGVISWIAKAFCRHNWRPSRTWPGTVVCRRCGKRTYAG